MIINEAGTVGPSLYAVATADVPIYLLDGDRPALFDAGFACLSNLYIECIDAILKKRPPAYCFLTHSHFDHVGAVSALKKQYPEMEICAFEKVGQIMGRPGAVAKMKTLSQAAASAVMEYGIDILCFGHAYVYTGEDARNYIPRAMDFATAFRKRVEDCLRESSGDIEHTQQAMRAYEYDGKTGPKQPEPAYMMNLEARILAVQRRMEQKEL